MSCSMKMEAASNGRGSWSVPGGVSGRSSPGGVSGVRNGTGGAESDWSAQLRPCWFSKARRAWPADGVARGGAAGCGARPEAAELAAGRSEAAPAGRAGGKLACGRDMAHKLQANKLEAERLNAREAGCRTEQRCPVRCQAKSIKTEQRRRQQWSSSSTDGMDRGVTKACQATNVPTACLTSSQGSDPARPAKAGWVGKESEPAQPSSRPGGQSQEEVAETGQNSGPSLQQGGQSQST